MKKLLRSLVFILLISTPSFGGHSVAGNMYCDCNTPGCLPDYDGECGNRMLSASKESPSNDTAEYGTGELGIALVAILLWLRLKA